MSKPFSLEPNPPPQPQPAPEPPPEAVAPPVAVPPPDDAPPEDRPTVVAQRPPGPNHAGESPPADAWSLPVRRKTMSWLQAKGVGAATLVVIAFGIGVVSALCLAIEHPGFGALLGLLAVSTAWLARTPGTDGGGPDDDALPFVHAVSEIVAAVILGGFVLGVRAVPIHAFVRVSILAGLLLLSVVRHVDGGRSLPRGPVVLSWAERLAVLMVGILLGNPALIAFILLGVVFADLLVRLALIRPRRPREAALPPGLASCFRPDGSLHPPIRWALMAISVLLCIVFGTEEGWRF